VCEPLLRRQAHELFQAIQAAGINPSDFRLETSNKRGSYADVKLSHVPTGYFCTFLFHMANLQGVSYSPEEDTRFGESNVDRWSSALRVASRWLECLRRELQVPDIWVAIAEGRAPDALDSLPNTPFAEAERQAMSDRLRGIEAHILKCLAAERTVTDEDVAFIKTKLAEAEEARNRLGRKDYVTYFMGAMTAIVIRLAVTPETAGSVWNFAVKHMAELASAASSLAGLP
jgi:hypothetical protein